MAKNDVPKCSECEFTSFMKINGGANRYYCSHPYGRKAHCSAPLICRTERHRTELTIKTSPRWCQKRKEPEGK